MFSLPVIPPPLEELLPQLKAMIEGNMVDAISRFLSEHSQYKTDLLRLQLDKGWFSHRFCHSVVRVRSISSFLFIFEQNSSRWPDSNLALHYIGGNDALMTSIAFCHMDTMKLLVESGSNVNSVAFFNTPLILAVNHTMVHLSAVPFLLDHGASPNLGNLSRTWTPMHEAAKKVCLVLGVLSTPFIFVSSTHQGNLIDLELLLQHGGQVDIEDSEGRTPLMVANTSQTAQFLLEHVRPSVCLHLFRCTLSLMLARFALSVCSFGINTNERNDRVLIRSTDRSRS